MSGWESHLCKFKTVRYIFSQVKSGFDSLLFNLLILGVLKSGSGQVWRRRLSDLYLIELTTGPTQGDNETLQRQLKTPKVSCRPENVFVISTVQVLLQKTMSFILLYLYPHYIDFISLSVLVGNLPRVLFILFCFFSFSQFISLVWWYINKKGFNVRSSFQFIRHVSDATR